MTVEWIIFALVAIALFAVIVSKPHDWGDGVD